MLILSRNQKKYTNQLGKAFLPHLDPLNLTMRSLVAAMPSLHFGYALMIGLTLVTLPLGCSSQHSDTRNRRCTWCSWQCTVVRTIGVLYPSTILLAIIATANHFILDAVVGAVICGLASHWNGIMLNLLPLEDVLLWCLRVHKPSVYSTDLEPIALLDLYLSDEKIAGSLLAGFRW